jgi:CARDB
MPTNPLCKLALLCIAVASLTQATANASPPKKSLSPTRHAVVTGIPAADKELEPAAKAGAQTLTPAGVNKFPAANKFLGGPIGLPDLVPVPYFGSPAMVGLPAGFPGVEYCDPNPAGGVPNKVRFRIHNLGGSSAPPFNVRFNFNGGGAVFVPVNGLSQGSEKSGAVDIPAGCFPDGYSTVCQFTITVDSSGQIGESNEVNNSTHSFCVGPAT